MAKKDLFLVSSALVTVFGSLPEEERVRQTMQTLASIRQYAPDADIVVLELSRQRIGTQYIEMFKQYQPRHILHVDDAPQIIQNYQMCTVENDPDASYLKNLNEIAAMQIFLNWGMQVDYFKDYRRVFKVSGRYELCEPFNLQTYAQDAFTGRCAFLKLPAYQDLESSGCLDYCYSTRLWSFDVALIPKLTVWFEAMFDVLLKRYQLGYTDIEHLLPLLIPRQYCVYLDSLGIRGHVGLNGQLIQE